VKRVIATFLLFAPMRLSKTESILHNVDFHIQNTAFGTNMYVICTIEL
jgi:hypothetical protein